MRLCVYVRNGSQLQLLRVIDATAAAIVAADGAAAHVATNSCRERRLRDALYALVFAFRSFTAFSLIYITIVIGGVCHIAIHRFAISI